MISADFEVLGIGNPILDHSIPVSDEFLASLSGRKGGMELISLDQCNHILASTKALQRPIPSGCTVNVIRGLAHLGHSCRFVGKAGGADPISGIFSSTLQDIGVYSTLIPSKAATAHALCLITPDGERTLRTFIGAAGKLKPKHISEDLFKNVRHVHTEGYGMYHEGVIEKIVDLAHKKGLSVSMDLGSFETVERYKERFLQIIHQHGVNVLFANENEASVLTHQSPEEACQTLSSFCESVVVTQGAHGCWSKGKDLERPIHTDAEQVKNVVDTTGAGDTFAAGFIHGYLAHLPTATCAQKGSFVAAKVVQIQGVDLPKSEWIKIK